MNHLRDSLFDATKDAIAGLHLIDAKHDMPYICWKHPRGTNFLVLYDEVKLGTWVGIRHDSIPEALLTCRNDITTEDFKYGKREKADWRRYYIRKYNDIAEVVDVVKKVMSYSPDWR